MYNSLSAVLSGEAFQWAKSKPSWETAVPEASVLPVISFPS